MKPEPLNFEKTNEKVFGYFCEMLFGTKNPEGIESWEDFGQIGRNGLFGEEIKEVIEFTISEIKQ